MTPPQDHQEGDPNRPVPKSLDDDSPWKLLRYADDLRNSSCETASLSCSDSQNSDVSFDTDEESISVSPDKTRRRYRRISPISRSSEFSLTLHVIKDLSFDDHSLAEEKIHVPSKDQKCENRKRQLVCLVSLVVTGLVYFYFMTHQRRPQSPHWTDWKDFLQNDAAAVRRLIETSPVPNSFSIRLSGCRTDLMQRNVDVLTRCYSVEEIQIDWQSAMRPPRKLFRHASGKVAPLHSEPVSNAILLLDEDVMFTCDELERGFHLWQVNPDRMVGFFPYHHSAVEHHLILDYSTSLPSSDYQTVPVSPGTGNYELVSSRASFIHNEYLKSHVPKNDACRQFALSVHSTAISHKAPLAVAAQPQEQRTSDLAGFLPRQEWKQEKMGTCLREWIQGHGITDMPSERSTYLGRA